MLWFTSPEEKRKDQVKQFWRWFQQHETELQAFERNPEKVFGELARAVRPIGEDITFEFGPVENSRRILVVSAGGIRGAIPAVQALVAGAPALPQWQVVAFRQRMPCMVIEMNGVRITPDDICCTLEPDRGLIGITLFMKGYTEAQHNLYGSAGFILLDQALGEMDVMTKVGFVEFKPWDSPAQASKVPLPELASAFDTWTR